MYLQNCKIETILIKYVNVGGVKTTLNYFVEI